MAIDPEMLGYMPQKVESTSAVTEMMISRQAQEVQAAMVIAKRFPRDEYQAFQRIMRACERKILAECAVYEYPRGGTKVSGPSIRLAEVLAQCWGNIDSGILELEQKPGESTVMAYAWDLETNTRNSKVFTVRHERKAGSTISKLTDPRDIYEMIANQGARRVRSCILAIVPGDIVDAAVEQCEKTLINGQKEPLQDRVRNALNKMMAEYGVTKEMVEKYIGCKADAFSEQDYLRIGKVYRSLRDGMAKREDYFDIRVGQESGSNAEEEFKKAQEQKKQRGNRRQQESHSEPVKDGESDGDGNTGDVSTDGSQLLFGGSEPPVSE